jgi:hypothetical protein
MAIITYSRRMWMVSLAVSVVIFGVIYFTVIRPDNNAANQVLKSATKQGQLAVQQTQQALKQAQQQASSASGQAAAATGAVSATVNKTVKLASCVTAAGTDTTKIAACESKYGH